MRSLIHSEAAGAAAVAWGGVLLHLLHVLLQVAGDLSVFLTEVEKGGLEVFVFVRLATLEENLVLSFALLNHHLDHKYHLLFLILRLLL